MGIRGFPVQQGDIEIWYSLAQRTQMVGVTFQTVCRLACKANLVFSSVLEPVGFICDFGEEPKTFFLWDGVLFDHANEVVYLSSDGLHGGGDDSIDFTECCKVAGKVDG